MRLSSIVILSAVLALSACTQTLGPDSATDVPADDRGDGPGDNQNPGDEIADPNDPNGPNPNDPNDPVDPTDPVDPNDPPALVPPGSQCVTDTECEGTTANPGVCVIGVCMQRAADACSTAGSSAECGTGSRCWDVEASNPVCWPDCDAFTCAGTCDADGSCAPNDVTGAACDPNAATWCPDGTGSGGDGGGSDGCPPNSTLDGESCYCNEGYVVNAAGTGCEAGQSGGGDGCPPNSHLEGDSCYCDAGFNVNSDGSACVHECDTDGDCAGGDVCAADFTCQPPPCTPGSCGAGMVCSASGRCVTDLGSPPPGSPPSSCPDSPDYSCSGTAAYCGERQQFIPRLGDGYWDYPLNGETEQNQYRSYARRDLVRLVKYAAAETRCLGEGWAFGNGGPLGLGDMSEYSGAIPGTSDGSPGHPAGTHEEGRDMDIAYFQTGTADNKLRAVCDHTSGGYDQWHCVSEPDLLDVWRSAMFIGKLHDHPNLRVIGVDGQVGPLIESAIDQLCGAGWLDGNACSPGGLALAYEVTDGGNGWFSHHHHHLHVSLLSGGTTWNMPWIERGRNACLSVPCADALLPNVDPRRLLYKPLKTRIVE